MNATMRLLVAVAAGLAAGAALWCAAESMRPRSVSNPLARRRSQLASGNALVVAIVAGLVVLLVTPLGSEQENDWEGCLSVPGMRGLVPRWQRVRYQGFGIEGEPIDRSVEGFHARVVQHECDHLAGVLYPMRMQDLSQFGFTEVLFPGLAPDADE